MNPTVLSRVLCTGVHHNTATTNSYMHFGNVNCPKCLKLLEEHPHLEVYLVMDYAGTNKHFREFK